MSKEYLFLFSIAVAPFGKATPRLFKVFTGFLKNESELEEILIVRKLRVFETARD